MSDADYPSERLARGAAPPYRGEREHAMWHFSEDPRIRRFEPRTSELAGGEGLVWAIDSRHAPMFWFPRDCPRGCAWATEGTSPDDTAAFFGHTQPRRIHVIESAWLSRMRECALYAYQLPLAPFEPHEVGGYWVSRAAVEPLEVSAVGDLLALHTEAGIELRVTPSIWPWWAAVIRSTLEFSGSRLRNCTVPEPEWVRPAPTERVPNPAS